jgi:TonB-dependent starch-binding outer membrane protein SusC
MQFIDCCIPPPRRWGVLTKTLMVMKLTAILLFVACMEVSAAGNAQTVTLSLRNSSLERVFKEVKKQTGYGFIYTREQLANTGNVNVDVQNAPLEEVLDHCFSGQPVTYTIEDGYIIVKPRALVPPKLIDTAGPVNKGAKIKLQGRVVDASGGESLAGASVSLRQQGQAASVPASVTGTTDAGGGFRITNVANGTYIMDLTFIGYEKLTRIVTLTDKPQILILPMKRSTSTLDAIQTTAYSKTTMRFNTGDITTVTAEEIARNPVSNVLDALQGRVAGLQVTSMSGETNGAYSVQVRSLNTLAGGDNASPLLTFNNTTGQPLYIVNGVEYPANGGLPIVANVGAGDNALEGGNALNYLDPSLIESINVLKGADATAIYGSRGAFGVILITTKKAKAGKPSVFVSAQQGFSENGPTPKLLNNQQYLAMRHGAFTYDNTYGNNGIYSFLIPTKPGPGDWDLNGTWDSTKSTNWEKYLIGGHAPTTRASANYSGGSDNSSYLISGNYTSIGNVELNRGNVQQGSINLSLQTSTPNKKFNLALTGMYGVNVDSRVPVDFSSFLAQAPDAQLPYLPNGQLNWANGYNVAAVLNSQYKNSTDNLLSNLTATYTPVKGLSIIAAAGVSLLSAQEFTGEPSTVFNPLTFVATQRVGTLNTYYVRTISADPRIQYGGTLWKKGVLNVIAGASIRDQVTEQDAVSGKGFLSDALVRDPTSAPQSNISTLYYSIPDRYTGLFTQITYRWADKYILDLNGRRDGSSLFGNNRQFGNFGSVAGGWIISEEPWFRSLRNTIDFLKLKGSYGVVGGNSLSPFQYLSTFQVSGNSYQGGNGLTPTGISNPYLHWETDKNAEGGINFDLFKGRINLETIYYSDRVGDQLGAQPLASITGFTSVTVNLPATIHTYGWEVTATSHNIRNKDFTWDTKINFTAPRTKLLSYPGLNTLVGNANWIIGKPITGIKLFRYAGVNPATGVYNFYDSAGAKGEYDALLSSTQLNAVSDKTAFVNLAPVWYGGITNSFTYKRFGMDFLVYITDRVAPNYLGFQSSSLGQFNTNWPADLVARQWKKPGDKTDVPAATVGLSGLLDQQNFRNSTGAFSNATYARLQNLSISYHFSNDVAHRVGATQISIFAAGQNLLTVSKYGDLDPENMAAGHLPSPRVFTGGFNVTF